MALTVVQYALCVAFVILFQDSCSWALRIETVPEPFNERIDTQLNISCIPDGPDYWAKQIQTLQVVKEDKTIAILRWRGLQKGPGSKPNMQIDSNIEKDASRSFLKIIINKPGKEDIGTYTCLMYFEDEDFHLREEKSSANVTVDNEDISSIVSHLFEKVVQLDKTVQDQETELKQQRNVISEQEKALTQQRDLHSKQNKLLMKTVSDLETTIEKQGKQLMDQKKKVSDLEIDQLKQANYTMELEKTIEEQREKVSDLEIDLLKQQNYTMDLEKTIQEQGKQLMDQKEKVSFSVAFSVYGTKSTIFNSGETLKFNHYQLNIGDHYDLNTGVFTTPKKGLYTFHLSVWTNNRDNAWVYLKVNDDIMTGVYAWDDGSPDQSSVNTVISLKEGDRVWPYFRHGAVLAYPNDKLTLFNGYLLKLL